MLTYISFSFIPCFVCMSKSFVSNFWGAYHPRAPRSPAWRKPVPSPSSASVFPPPASRTFRGYSRLRREITSSQLLSSAPFSRKKNAQAHKIAVLRISSYHAAKNPCFSEKQLHKMIFFGILSIYAKEMSERFKQDQEYETWPGVFRQKGRRDVEVFSSAAMLH